MKIEKISEIRIEPNYIFVKPQSMSYEYIYRDASGIRWDKNNKALYNYEMKEWDYCKWFIQIVYSVLSEYGNYLVISKNTKWINVNDEIREKIIKSYSNYYTEYYRKSIINVIKYFYKTKIKK